MVKRLWYKIFESCLCLSLLLSGCVAISAPVTDPAIVLSDLVAALPPGTALAFTGFSGLDGEQTELADIAAFRLEPMLVNMCRDNGVSLIERDKLRLILNEWKLEMNGMTKSDNGARELMGADIIITGKVKVELPVVHIFVKAINLKDGKILAVAEIRQAAKLYGKSALVKNKSGGAGNISNLPTQKSNQAASDDGKIKLWTLADSYAVGQKLTVFFEVTEAAYVSVVDITPNGEKLIVFPNLYQKNNFCKPGIIYQVPPADAPFDLEVTEPIGRDRLMAMTSDKPQIDPALLKIRGLKFTDAVVTTTSRRASIAFDIH